MSIFLATYSTSPGPITIISNTGRGSIIINETNILRFTDENIPTQTFNIGDTIYLDIENINNAKLQIYNKWAFNINDFKKMNFIYYLRPTGITNITNLSNSFDLMFCPYNDIIIDVDINNTIKNISFSWTDSKQIDISLLKQITYISLTHNWYISNIIGLDTTTIKYFSIIDCPLLKQYVENYVNNMTNLTSLIIAMIGLNQIPNISNLINLESLGIYYNNLAGSLDLTKLPESLISISANGNNYTDIIFPEYVDINGIIYGKPNSNMTSISISENLIQSFYCDCSNLKSLVLPANPLEHLYLQNLSNIQTLRFECCKLRSININGIYMEKCSVIRQFFDNISNYSSVRFHNNYLNMDEQNLNISGKLYLNPQFRGNQLLYDPFANSFPNNLSSIQTPTALIDENTKDPYLYMLNMAIYFNIDFNNIDEYCEDYNDEFIRQRILTFTYNNGTLHIYNAQNLLNNPNSTLSKSLQLAGKYFKLKEIKTNDTNINKFFPNTPIIFSDSPTQNPSIFSIYMIVND